MYLDIDLGTSSVKTAVIDEAGCVRAQGHAALTLQSPQTLWSEQHPEGWWDAAAQAVRALPLEVRREVHGIGLSGQMHGAVLLDSHDLVLRPAILWNDGRSGPDCVELERREPRAREITGNLVMPGFTAPKLLWVARNEPDVFTRIRSVLMPKDFLRLRMTGEKVSDMSDASGTLWLDVGRRNWSDAMLTASGLNRTQMPRLVEGSAPAARLHGDVVRLWGLPTVMVAGGGGDNAASAVGSGIMEPGQAFLSLGTSGVLFVVTDQFRPALQQAAHAFCHALPGGWHQMSVMLSASSALDWAASIVGFPDVTAAAYAAQERTLQRTTPLFLPYLAGERTPHNDPFARGVFFGLTAQTSAADLVVAVLAGVALAFADGLDTLTAVGSPIDDIVIVGGGARIAYWVKILSAALRRRLTMRQGGDTGSAVGAARLGRLASTGEAPGAVCLAPPIMDVFEPDEALAQLLHGRRSLSVPGWVRQSRLRWRGKSSTPRSISSFGWACLSSRFTTSMQWLARRHCVSMTRICGTLRRRLPRRWRRRPFVCCGEPPIYLPILATPPARQPARIRRSLRGPLPKCASRWKPRRPIVAARHLASGTFHRVGLLYANPSQAYLSELLVGALEEATAVGLQLAVGRAIEPRRHRPRA